MGRNVSEEAWLDLDGDRTGFSGRFIGAASDLCVNSYCGNNDVQSFKQSKGNFCDNMS